MPGSPEDWAVGVTKSGRVGHRSSRDVARRLSTAHVFLAFVAPTMCAGLPCGFSRRAALPLPGRLSPVKVELPARGAAPVGRVDHGALTARGQSTFVRMA